MYLLFTILVIISMYFIFKGTFRCEKEICDCSEQSTNQVFIDNINSQQNTKMTQLYTSLFNDSSILPNQLP